MSTLFHGFKKLRSGDLTLLYKDGEIRQVCLGSVQVLNAVYTAVRDQNWTTIPYRVCKESVQEGGDGFIIGLDLEYSLEEILYRARMFIEATGNKLLVSFDGEAQNTFLRNRIGLCILHPIKECKGKSVLITHPDGSQSEGSFPERISPDQPFINISGMRWNPGRGITAVLSFEGEVFESEDQRNWSDASYKTYGTPLVLPYPATVDKGDQVHQSVTLVVEPEAVLRQPSASGSTPSSLSAKKILTLRPDKTSSLPGLGTGRSAEAKPLTREESEILSTLPFHHYRVDLHLSRKKWKKVYDSVVEEQKQLGWPLELALHFGTYPGKELDAFVEQSLLQPLNIGHLLIFDRDFLSNSELLKQVVPTLKAVFPDTPVGGGTDTNFAELNRNRPHPQLLDFISYSICPQVHAFDDLTLLENLEAQYDSLSGAISLFSKPVSIGAISLKQRFNAVAADDENESQAMSEPDPRQHTSFTAGWTLASIRNLAMAGAASLTYFEAVGPRGILSRQPASLAHSPLYHLFKEILTVHPVQVIPTISSCPLEFDGLALLGQKEGKLLLANYTESELSIELAGLPGIPHRLTLSPLEIYTSTWTP